jgi:hypothetical protein
MTHLIIDSSMCLLAISHLARALAVGWSFVHSREIQLLYLTLNHLMLQVSLMSLTGAMVQMNAWGDEASPDDGVNEVASIEHEVPMMTEAFDRLKLCGNVYHGPSYPSLYLRILTSSEDNGRGKQDDYLMARAERLMAQYLENSRLEGEDYYEKDQMNEPFLKFKKKLADYPNQLIRCDLV